MDEFWFVSYCCIDVNLSYLRWEKDIYSSDPSAFCLFVVPFSVKKFGLEGQVAAHLGLLKIFDCRKRILFIIRLIIIIITVILALQKFNSLTMNFH
jgi:hypothetical protein